MKKLTEHEIQARYFKGGKYCPFKSEQRRMEIKAEHSTRINKTNHITSFKKPTNMDLPEQLENSYKLLHNIAYVKNVIL